MANEKLQIRSTEVVETAFRRAFAAEQYNDYALCLLAALAADIFDITEQEVSDYFDLKLPKYLPF